MLKMPHQQHSKNIYPMTVVKHRYSIDLELNCDLKIMVMLVPDLLAHTSIQINIARRMIDGTPSLVWIVPYP